MFGLLVRYQNLFILKLSITIPNDDVVKERSLLVVLTNTMAFDGEHAFSSLSSHN